MLPWDIISKLEATPGRNDKTAIVASEINNQEFWDGVRLAMDPMITFGVKQVPIHTGIQLNESQLKDQNYKFATFQDFTALLDKLADRKLTGHAARDAIQTLMGETHANQWNNWYRRIILKDLRCGCDTTFNKVKPGAVPLFECQLARAAKDVHEKYSRGKKFLDFKLDGVRTLPAVRQGVPVTLHSRNGHEFENFPQINAQFEGIKDLLVGKFAGDWVFDGEIVSANFQALMTQLQRKDDAVTDDAVLNLFDMIPLEDFLTGTCKIPQEERDALLKEFYEIAKDRLPSVMYLEKTLVDMDTPEGKEALGKMVEKAAELGLEGIMVKDPKAPYENGKGNNWLKIKPWITVDLTVKALEPGEIGTKYEFTLGALQCEGVDDGKHIVVSVGSGLKDPERDAIWGNPGMAIGHIAEIRADAVTQNQKGAYSLRFPRFLRWRDMKAGQKI